MRGDDAFAFLINFDGERACEDNMIMVKIDNTTISKVTLVPSLLCKKLP